MTRRSAALARTPATRHVGWSGGPTRPWPFSTPAAVRSVAWRCSTRRAMVWASTATLRRLVCRSSTGRTQGDIRRPSALPGAFRSARCRNGRESQRSPSSSPRFASPSQRPAGTASNGDCWRSLQGRCPSSAEVHDDPAGGPMDASRGSGAVTLSDGLSGKSPRGGWRAWTPSGGWPSPPDND